MTKIASLLWALRSVGEARRWRRAAREVAAAQRAVLLRIVRANAECELGRQHGFAAIDSVRAFQQRVPLRSYDDFRPSIDRIAAGAPRVLTCEPVIRFGLTSGSTGGSKLVPYTRSLFAELRRGISAWIWRLFRQHPAALLGKAYWSVTPAAQRVERSSGGIPIGFDDERPYFDRFTRFLLRFIMAVPPDVARIADVDAFRDATLHYLLQERALSWISVWSPTFLTLLLEPLSERRIFGVRRQSRRFQGGAAAPHSERSMYERIWPHLRLISCWAGGAAADSIPLLKSYFPNVVIEPKGLLATEAFVSFPYDGQASALSLRSHFFEFEKGDSIFLAHELKAGERYSVVVTTSGGFYRYRLHDVIEVVGHVDQCPLLRFIGRADAVVDLRGEKLHEIFAAEAVRQTLAKQSVEARFAMLAPTEAGDGYVLFIQTDDAADLAADLDDALRASFQYDYCRRLGQLRRCEVFRIDPAVDAAARYLAQCAALGQRLGDIKPAALHPFRGWAKVF